VLGLCRLPNFIATAPVRRNDLDDKQPYGSAPQLITHPVLTPCPTALIVVAAAAAAAAVAVAVVVVLQEGWA
jgi:hypothetical protein